MKNFPGVSFAFAASLLISACNQEAADTRLLDEAVRDLLHGSGSYKDLEGHHYEVALSRDELTSVFISSVGQKGDWICAGYSSPSYFSNSGDNLPASSNLTGNAPQKACIYSPAFLTQSPD